jgi:3-hydroxybutyryl-CoA dehydrogenase
MKTEDVRRILMIGSGTMGRQVGWQFATHGYDVVLHDVSNQALRDAADTLDGLAEEFTSSGLLTTTEASAARARIEFESDVAEAAGGIDMVSESIPENLDLKRRVFAQFHGLCPPEAIFTTNTSSLLPSKIARSAGRPGQFCAFHFHQPVWHSNVVDIMPHPGTDADVVTLLAGLAIRIDQVPIVLDKESPGYVFNAMLDAVLSAAMQLRAENIATVEDVDRAWMGVTKMPIGPFGILDLVGIDLANDVVSEKTNLIALLPRVRRLRGLLQAKVDAGELGIKSGKGFYEYPDPAYQHSGFVSGLRNDPDAL